MTDPRPVTRGTWRILLFYVSAVGIALAIFFAVAWFGEETLTRTAQVPAGGREMSEQIDTLLHVLLALAVIIVTARVVGKLFRFLHQPPVIGEVIAGILLGPSLLGYVAPAVYEVLLPQRAAPFLGVIAQLGVILYMFLVGLRARLGVLRHSGTRRSRFRTRASSCPFLLGIAPRALPLPELSPPRRDVHGLRAVHRRLDVGYRVPGARADSDRPRDPEDPHGHRWR